MNFKATDPLLMTELRLATMSVLHEEESADFTYLREVTSATAGNLSAQLSKLEAAGYIRIEKRFDNNRPLTTCYITEDGRVAFETHLEALKSYFPNRKKGK